MRLIFIAIIISVLTSQSISQIKGIIRPEELDLAQRDTTRYDSLEKVKIIGKYTAEGIKLKWAPISYEYWERYNQLGYTLERFWYDSLGNGSKNYELLTRENIKPWSLKKLELYLKSPDYDDYVAIVGQAVYGKTDASDFRNWTDPIDEKENRYVYALLSTEFSKNAAQAAGLYFEDKDVLANRTYQYRLIAHALKPNQQDTVYLYLNTYEKDTIPQPFISTSKIEDGYLIIGWNRQMHKRHFSGYYIERSGDGKNFKRMNKKPYVNPETENLTLGSELITWKDTSTVNYMQYQYRIIGITSFAELSKPSAAVSLMTIDKTPPAQPKNIQTRHLGGKRVEISWEHDGKEPDLAGFMIGRSRNANAGFESISGDKAVSKTRRTFIDERCDDTSTNFYIVAAVDTAGNAAASLISYAAILDSIPPGKPKGLTGSIDTSGVVTLSWAYGKEMDIKGYLVHTSNAVHHVFTCITGDAVQDTFWTDTITLNTLTKAIFYKIQAVDLLGNISEFSEVIRLLKPDIVPPVKPVIHDFLVEVGQVTLKWQASTSKDVEHHILKRKKPNDTAWTDIFKINGQSIASYTDQEIEQQQDYYYTLVAVDSTGNISDHATIVPVKTLKDLRNPLQNFQASIDENSREIHISWDAKANSRFREVIIYKALNNGPVLSYKRIPAINGQKNTFTEKAASKAEVLEYTTKVVFENGMTSGFSPMVRLELK